MIHISGNKIELREHIFEDFKDIHNWMSDTEVMKFVGMGPTYSQEESLIRFAEILKESFNPYRRNYYLAIINKTDNKYAGAIWLSVLSKEEDGGIAEVTIILPKEQWSKGFSTEAIFLIVDFGFKELGLHKIFGMCNSNNRVVEKIFTLFGAVKEAELKKDRFRNGEWEDTLIYSLFKEVWYENARKAERLLAIVNRQNNQEKTISETKEAIELSI